ncbi:MAG: DUF3515 family protein [Rhodoluna sp.]
MKIFKALALIALTLSMSSCAATVTLDAAPNANDPSCAEVIVRLPDAVGDLSKRVTNAQSTGAWGSPASVILRCGLAPVEASTLTCVTAKDIDWLVDDSAKPNYRFTTFGRSPATEVIVDSTAIAGVTALEALAGAIENIPATKRCQ